MNNPTVDHGTRDSIVTAVSVLVILLGAATGNALAMLGMGLVAFAVLSAIYRQDLVAKWVFALLAAVVAAGIAYTLTGG